MEFIRKQPGTSIAAAFIIGLLFGLIVLGWGVWPVQWTGAGPQDLDAAHQAIYIRSVAEQFSNDNNTNKVVQALSGWGGDVAACQLAANATDPADRQRLEAVAGIVSGQGCTAVANNPATSDDAGKSPLATILLLLILLLLIVAILFVFNRRNAMMRGETDGNDRSTYAEVPTSSPLSGQESEVTTVPIARFRTTYNHGHDTYDDSFSIENANGDFLGECGVGISEVLGSGSPKDVTALEIWLFDKNDIRTITKVVMSDHAFFDDAIKAKLAPKGEPVQARENETIVLETASLIVNAQITDMVYGSGSEQSIFDRFTIELSAWAKEGDFAPPDVEGRVDELLNY